MFIRRLKKITTGRIISNLFSSSVLCALWAAENKTAKEINGTLYQPSLVSSHILWSVSMVAKPSFTESLSLAYQTLSCHFTLSKASGIPQSPFVSFITGRYYLLTFKTLGMPEPSLCFLIGQQTICQRKPTASFWRDL